MNIFYYSYLFFIGSSFASFYYLLAGRIPKGEKIGWSRSKCDQCHNPLAFRDLFPVLSFLFLKGRCRYCKQPLPSAYCIFEIIGGFFSIHLFLQCTDSFLLFLFYAFVYSVLFLIAAIDQQHLIIPDSLQFALLILFLIEHHINSNLSNRYYFFGSLAMLLIGLFSNYLVANGLGGGDIKLITLFGFSLGFYHASLALFYAATLALLYFAFTRLLYKTSLSYAIPFAPFLVLGFILVKEGFLLFQ